MVEAKVKKIAATCWCMPLVRWCVCLLPAHHVLVAHHSVPDTLGDDGDGKKDEERPGKDERLTRPLPSLRTHSTNSAKRANDVEEVQEAEEDMGDWKARKEQ